MHIESKVSGVQLFSLITYCNVVELDSSNALVSALSDKSTPTIFLQVFRQHRVITVAKTDKSVCVNDCTLCKIAHTPFVRVLIESFLVLPADLATITPPQLSLLTSLETITPS